MTAPGAGSGARVAAGAGAVAEAFARAAGHWLHPRVILSSLLPLLLLGGALALLGWAGWEAAVAAVRATLERWELVSALLRWLEALGAPQLRTLLAPLIVVALATPVVAVVCLALVALLMVPALVRLVAARRFAALQREGDTAAWRLWAGTLGSCVLALLALAASLPLWLLPPLVLVLPPLIWGWLAGRVLTRAVLAGHASAAEARRLRRAHRAPLLAMGLASGVLAALPSALWSLGAVALIFAPLLMVVAVWLHLAVFTFAALWFAHYALAALQRQRAAAHHPSP